MPFDAEQDGFSQSCVIQQAKRRRTDMYCPSVHCAHVGKGNGDEGVGGVGLIKKPQPQIRLLDALKYAGIVYRGHVRRVSAQAYPSSISVHGAQVLINAL